MSAAAAPRITQEYSRIPNSLIENLGQLTRAEAYLALIVLRRTNDGKVGTLSDRTWEEWTGFTSRQKELAVKGLKEKGLHISGRGDKARYEWRGDQWANYVRHAARTKPHTAGRKLGVTPNPGAKIHPACKSGGCSLLADENAKPVSQNPSGQSSSQNKLTLLNPSKNAKPVSQTSDQVERAWVKTIEVLRGFYPAVAIAFVLRLVGIVSAMFANVQDEELARAVAHAYERRKQTQKSEGLFFLTVPESLALLRRLPAAEKGAGAAVKADPWLEMTRHVIDALRTRGAPLSGFIPDIEQFERDMSEAKNGADLDRLFDAAELLKGKISDAQFLAARPEDREHINAAVFAELLQQRDDVRPRLETLFRRRATLSYFKIPALELF